MTNGNWEPTGRDACRHRAQLQCQPGDDFTAHAKCWRRETWISSIYKGSSLPLEHSCPDNCNCRWVRGAAWWFRGTVDKGQIQALKEKYGVAEERARLAADKAQPAREQALDTDEKGNVKPPEKPSASETPPDERHAERNEYSLFLKMELAYLEEGDCLSKVTEYYDKLKSVVGGLIHLQQIEAEYLLARFRCGASSALDTLKAQSGPTVGSFFPTRCSLSIINPSAKIRRRYSIFNSRFDRAPDSTRKFNAAISLGEFRAEIGEVADGISFLKSQISYFHAPNDEAALWQAIGRMYEFASFALAKTVVL